MAPKEPNRHQLSSRLSYSQHTPAFLQKLKNRIAGVPDEEEDYDDEFEDDGSGRPPIPRRPAIPQRPDDDPGSADEDDMDEKPQVVVLKEGKHLTAHEAENVRRKEKGLPPLPDPAEAASKKVSASDASASKEPATAAKAQSSSLSFSSSKGRVKSSSKKRKIIGEPDVKDSKTANTPSKKKTKKASKTLLSFGDDA